MHLRDILIVIAVIGAIALFIMYVEDNERQAEHLKDDVDFITLDDGLECVFYAAGYKAGLTCNWDKWNKQQKAKAQAEALDQAGDKAKQAIQSLLESLE